MIDIFKSIPNEIEIWPRFNDEIVWIPEVHGRFTLKSAYNLVCRNWDDPLSWPSLIWFAGCIKKHSICAWMFLRRRLKTKDFLLQRNVDCDSCCMFCNCTWETSTHLMIHCPYSSEVWTSLLSKVNLNPMDCTSPIELLDSIILPFENQEKGVQTLGKLLFNAFIWHIWAERNGRIFRSTSKTSGAVLQQILHTVCSRIVYLGITLPQDIACHWNIPPSSSGIRTPTSYLMRPGL